jgi:uncharacterized SAM-binding protein YcdF (DUF218 family)
MDLSLVKSAFKLLASPLNLFFICLCISMLCLIFKNRWRLTLAKWLTGASLCWLFLTSQYVFSNWLLHPLEYKYPAIKANNKEWQQIDAILVLGCYYYDTPELPLMSNWPQCSLSRLLQAKLMNDQKNTPIYVSGGHFLLDKNISYAEKAAELLTQFQVKDAIPLSAGTNTYTELLAFHQHYGDIPLAIVSSATHMRRVKILANKVGLTQVVLIPVEHLSNPSNPLTLNAPSLNSVYYSQRALYEYFALAYEYIRN